MNLTFGIKQLFQQLDKYNRDEEYLKYRQRDLRKTLMVLTIVAELVVFAFYIVDSLLYDEDILSLWIRIGAGALAVLNLALAYSTHHARRLRTHVIVGFYICMIYLTTQIVLTGGFHSPYWYSVSLTMIVWFIFIPFSYRALLFNGFLFLLLHFAGFFATDRFESLVTETAFQLFAPLFTFFIGSLQAILSNKNTADIFFNQRILAESESKYRSLIELASEGIVISRNGNMVFFNQAFVEMTGYSRDELREKTMYDLVSPEDHEKINSMNERRMQGNRFNAIYGVTGRTKTGHLLQLEINSSTVDFQGKPHSLIMIRDLSERVLAQQALIESEERYRTIFNLAGDAIMIMRYETGEFVDVNDAACKLYGYTRQEFLQLKNPDISGEPEASQEILKNNKGYVSIPERIHKCKDGTLLTVEIMGNVFHVNQEDLAISIVHDLTEKKRLRQELERSYAVLEENYSHTLEQMQTYFSELQTKKSELLRLQKENLQSQFDTLKKQVNPHFLFNSLNILSSLISVNPELAEEFTGNLSKIYRYVLEHEADDLVTLASELDFLQSYCFLLRIRFEEKVLFHVSIPEACLPFKVPPLAIQILIENAIKHNTFSLKSPLIIDIFVDEQNFLHIQNNYQPRENNLESTGVGLSNIANRYSFFTTKEPVFGLENHLFIAKIPLL